MSSFVTKHIAFHTPESELDDALTSKYGSLDQSEVLAILESYANENKVGKNFIGLGYYDTLTPCAIERMILEEPDWYTAYTPYQPEISQGRLEALFNFQTLVTELTGLPVAGSSLLDEGTAAAEAMNICVSATGKKKFLVTEDVFPQTLAVLKTRAYGLKLDLSIGSLEDLDDSYSGILLQYPNRYGEIPDLTKISAIKQNFPEVRVCLATDLLALLKLKSPGALGADIALGSSQRFGVPLFYGGPHAAFFACQEELKRSLPGRIVGMTKDTRGNNAYRLALQTREQHIRRDRATSNICTAQVLLAVVAAFYAVYHGRRGLLGIADAVHGLALRLQEKLSSHLTVKSPFFDTLAFEIPDNEDLITEAEDQGYFLGSVDGRVLVAFGEGHTHGDVEALGNMIIGHLRRVGASEDKPGRMSIPKSYLRNDSYLNQKVFDAKDETTFVRYLKSLQKKDYSLSSGGMIPLGSCTMKLNATCEMLPLGFKGFNSIHPFRQQVPGYQKMIAELRQMLLDIVGLDEITFQPNSGAQGEYAGLIAVRRYFESKGENNRNIALIPTSAHGTNPASAVLAGFKVVNVACNELGEISLPDLEAKISENRDNLGVIMVTYPSTHGVFEDTMPSLVEMVHAAGGQVYMDGANFNALAGVVNVKDLGVDVMHLNLHKTFCIPHGGGGPGVGPTVCAAHLAPFLPTGGNHFEDSDGLNAVSSAPFGSAAILVIPYVYIKLMGYEHIASATKSAIAAANYLVKELESDFKILYRDKDGKVAHEFIIDLREFKAYGVEPAHVARRLMDYGFHAPTMSWPVPGTLMVEPTESESKEELDRFARAMRGIRAEISRVERGEWFNDNNPLVNAPHTLSDIADWQHPYPIAVGAFPAGMDGVGKYWPSANAVDHVAGDRNLVCSACVGG